MTVSDEMCDAALFMLYQLNNQRLSVELAPSQDWECALRGGKIRVVTGRNPEWYQEFCAQYPPNRSRLRAGRRGQIDTAIKRQHTIRALKEIAGGQAGTEYARRLLPFVEKQTRFIERMISRGKLFF